MFIKHSNLNQESLGLIMQDVMDEDDGHIYFKALVDVLGEDLGGWNSTFEYVKGYAKILSHGLHINYSSNNLFLEHLIYSTSFSICVFIELIM